MNVLSIGGSDPSSGAGIQGDVRTFTSLGAHGLTVVTAITSQNTVKFSKTEQVSSSMIKDQLDAVFSDFAVDAIKIGMVYKSSVIKDIYSELKNVKAPIILDPVIRSTTNGSLIEKNALNAYKKLLVPLAFVKNYTYNSIKNSKKIGKGISITNFKKSEIEKSLSNSILDFTNLKNIYSLIPECQTNFVYSKPHPKSIHDILGISGRIVRAGKSVNVAGNLEYGASIHMASAILAVTKKFPLIRSALNLKYDSKIIKKFRENDLIVLSYDRTKEPSHIKRKENSSILWGMKNLIKKIIIPPDIIFHKGDFGKEPMIVVFGKNPSEVIKKISSIL